MNPEIKSIIKDMKERSPKNPIASSDKQNYLLIRSSELLVLLAEEAEKSTEKIGKLTWAIVFLTAFLVFTTFFELWK